MVMHTIELKAEEEELQTGEVAVFVGATVVSVRRGAKLGFVNVRRRSERRSRNSCGTDRLTSSMP